MVETLTAMNTIIKAHRILLKPGFQDFDRS
jgi:Ca2+-binding EF-hand superfamily protein